MFAFAYKIGKLNNLALNIFRLYHSNNKILNNPLQKRISDYDISFIYLA